MAAFLGVREALMPAADKRKRRRKDQQQRVPAAAAATDEPLSTAAASGTTTTDGGESLNGPKQKKSKMETRSSASKTETVVAMETEKIKPKTECAVLADYNESASIKSPLTKEAGDGQDWRLEDRLILLDQIQAVLPSDDNVKYSTMADKLCWSKVKVGDYSPDECKDEWQRISTKLRRFRTMSELVVDAKAWIKHPWNAFGKKTAKHPDMPKKPLTPYFRFFMAKRQKCAAKNPKMGVTDLTKELSKKYASLSEKKKKKYVDAYNKEMDEWKSAMVQFRKHHPEAFNEDEKQSSALYKHTFHTAPPKSTTAMQLYITEKYSDDKNSNVSRKQLYEKFKTEWFALSDNKKLKYIKLAIEAKEKYDADVEKYRQEHPDYQPRPVKSFLSKAEQKIKDHFDGKPEKPPVNGYSLFTVETLHLLTDLPNIERLGEVSRRWKKLTEDKREAYNLKADERNQEYRIKYEKYLQSLPEEERKKLEEEEGEKRKKLLPSAASTLPVSSAAVERPQKPIAAVFLFINDKKDEYRKKNPEMDDNELQRLLVKEYNCLSEKEKVKYKKLEEKEKQKVAQETVQPPPTSGKKVKKVCFPGEPPKPPHSGYQLFSKELLTQLKDVKANERLQEIGRRWLALSEEEKQQHNRRKDLMWSQYRKDVEKFKKSLAPKDRKQFEELNTPSKKKKKSKKEVKEEEADESSSADDEDEENEDDDGEESSTEAESSSSDEEDNEDADSSTSESESVDDSDSCSESEEDNDEDNGQAKTPANGNNVQTQGKSGRLSAKEVYNDSSNDSSSEDSDSDISTSSST